MMTCCPSRSFLITGVLLSIIASCRSWDPNSTCPAQSEDDNAVSIFAPRNGIIVYYASYLWCLEHCQNSSQNQQALADFILILLGFCLPAVIFSTVVPRRWRLDLSEHFFKISHHRILTATKLCISLPAICVVAALDMVVWITCIVTFVGPMVFGGVLEMFLDYRVVTFLKSHPEIPAKEGLEAIVGLLCGNLAQDPDGILTTGIHNALIPTKISKESLKTAKSRLAAITNTHETFGRTIGIPTAFFLVGFLYNAAQPTPTGTISFGIFWMVLVVAAIVSGTLLAGNDPYPISLLVNSIHVTRPRTRLRLLTDMYDSEFHPAPMWNRGLSKYQWLRNTTLWTHPSGTEQCVFRERIGLDQWSWAFITVTTWLLVAIPSFLSFSFGYFIPWPWFGCLSLLYTTYFLTQTLLVFAAIVMACLNEPFHNVWRPWHSLSRIPRSIGYTCSLYILAAFTGIATLAAASATVIGLAFQDSDRFVDACFCSAPVSSWLQPSSRRTSYLHFEFISQEHSDFVHRLEKSLYGSAAVFTALLCFLGWWYQRSLRGSLREVVKSIEA
ncbi:uncharacterized protein PAC_06357 [Phialocephala subalpina]|uniref:Uncharacterized protein n=1 Tax=Phialocephala subalpina TaxID=576137 RepID=A0A1L7WUM7_9HELO|nr:uncharacterized protein PAC_06357 [Phialocephala subalpina]